ncbi:MAG: Gfo/Idh/MocA family oxidoreductase [Anaerolineae bacterium]
MEDGITRREFLKVSTGLGSLTLGILPSFSMPVSLNVGLMGAGMRGRILLEQLLSFPNIRVSAVCDVSASALTAAADLLIGYETPYFTQDDHELLHRSDVDAVVIAIPDFSHAPSAAAALQAGKSVYLETPLTRTLEELDRLRQISRVTGQILYAADPAASHPGFAAAAGIVRSGLLGKITRVHIAKHRPPDESIPTWRNYRAFSYGAAIQELTHSLQRVHRVMNVSEPVSLMAHGGVYVWQDGRDNPDTLYAIAAYAEGFAVSFTSVSGDSAHDEFAFYGTRGMLDLRHWRITPENAVESPIPLAIAQAASEQLACAAHGASPHHADFAGWLTAIAQHHDTFPEHAAHQVKLTEQIVSALRG